MVKITAFLVSCCIVLAASIVSASPQLVVDLAEYDFGTVSQGEKVLHTFVLSNNGDTPLVIDKVRSSCGCTAALLSSNKLDPGDQGQLSANFDSERFRGHVSKTIYLYTNDPVAPVKSLMIKGQVLELFSLDPRQVNFGTVEKGKRIESRVTLTNNTGEDLQIDSAETTTPELSTRYDADLPAGESREILVSLKPKPGQERFSGYVILKAQGKKLYDLRLPVYATINK